MKKTAYILDSSSFLTEEEANKLGFHYMPLHVIIEGEDYLEGKTLDLDMLKEAIENKRNVSTSQPSPGEVIQLVEQLKSEGYDQAVFSGIASGLSKTQENVINTAKEDGFKVYNIDSKSVGNASKYPLIKARKLIEEDKMEIEEAIKYVQESEALKSLTTVSVGDLFHLSRGGRITPAAAALGSMLKIKPILKLVLEKDGQIDSVEKVRTEKKALKKMVELTLKPFNLNNSVVLIADFYGKDVAKELEKIVHEVYPELEIERYNLSPTIGVHVGLDSVGLQIVDISMLK
ncbi:DegV family protein [Mycoplasma sp. P36-A1]|uniref:DegV family protein n=1 Tax=Mycoplasma sp. P36-A1 TaxID=3252900 RepID=UPI003C30861D